MTQQMPAEQAVPNDYDAFAEAYARDNEYSAWNAHYERPAVLRLAGAVAGCRVLDAGCGAGSLSAELAERGADVVGLDSSAALLELATERLGGRGWTLHGDLRERLPFDAAAFDIVIASLVMHYLRDWAPTLHEFRRTLVPGGRLVISTHHPFMDHALAGGADYFATYDFSEKWRRGDARVRMRFWHRPLSAMTAALAAAGFALDVVDEPQPDAVVRDLDPAAWEQLTTRPRFIFFAATRKPRR